MPNVKLNEQVIFQENFEYSSVDPHVSFLAEVQNG